MKLKNANDKRAIYCGNTVGPTFGNGCDTNVDGSIVCLHPGRSYDHGPVIPNGSYTTYTIKEMEVFLVTQSLLLIPLGILIRKETKLGWSLLLGSRMT